MSLGKIIRQKRELLKLTLDQVAAQGGFSKPYLSTIETGKVKNPPSDELLVKLEKILGFKPGQLLQIAHLDKIPPDIRQQFESAEAQNLRFRKLIKQLKQKTIEPENIDSILADEDFNNTQPHQNLAPGHLIPVINKVAAGYPQDFDDLDYPVGIADDYVRCPDLNDPNAFAVRVIGDSMLPKFNQGDIVILSPAARVNNGDDCFIRFTMPHETTFKRVFFEPDNTIRLQPRNEKYSPIIVDPDRINGLYKAVIKYEQL